jgi:hypothetical protein
MDIPAFRQQFAEFVDPETYPDATLTFFGVLADKRLPADRWDDLHSYGASLFVAHHLVIGERNRAAAEAGGAPGEVKGPVASKSVDKVAVSYSAASVSLTNAGFWNMTTYGVQFLQLARMVGAGGIQL